MPVIRVDRFDDPRLADYRNVSDGELLRRRNLFVAEGRLVVGRLLESGHRVVSLLVNEASFRALEPLLSRVPQQTSRLRVRHGRVRRDHRLQPAPRLSRAGGAAGRARVADVVRRADLLLVLEGVTDPDNVGSAFRNAAAFGASVVLSEACCDPLYRKAIRTSMGSALRTPYARMTDWPRDLAALKAKGSRSSP